MTTGDQGRAAFAPAEDKEGTRGLGGHPSWPHKHPKAGQPERPGGLIAPFRESVLGEEAYVPPLPSCTRPKVRHGRPWEVSAIMGSGLSPQMKVTVKVPFCPQCIHRFLPLCKCLYFVEKTVRTLKPFLPSLPFCPHLHVKKINGSPFAIQPQLQRAAQDRQSLFSPQNNPPRGVQRGPETFLFPGGGGVWPMEVQTC